MKRILTQFSPRTNPFRRGRLPPNMGTHVSHPLYLDVRSPEEFAEKHVLQSKNIPVEVLAERLGELGAKDTPLIVYCRSGRRSARAMEILRAAGFSNLTDAGSIDSVRS